MSLTDKDIELLQKLYYDASLGLTTGKKIYDYLKSNGKSGYTVSKINEFLKKCLLTFRQTKHQHRSDRFF